MPDRLVGDDHAADQHELLDLTEAQRSSPWAAANRAIAASASATFE